jgi:hypothetical protein
VEIGVAAVEQPAGDGAPARLICLPLENVFRLAEARNGPVNIRKAGIYPVSSVAQYRSGKLGGAAALNVLEQGLPGFSGKLDSKGGAVATAQIKYQEPLAEHVNMGDLESALRGATIDIENSYHTDSARYFVVVGALLSKNIRIELRNEHGGHVGLQAEATTLARGQVRVDLKGLDEKVIEGRSKEMLCFAIKLMEARYDAGGKLRSLWTTLPSAALGGEEEYFAAAFPGDPVSGSFFAELQLPDGEDS